MSNILFTNHTQLMSKLPVDKFFQLLRYAIGTSVEFPKDIPEEMWTDIYKIARQQALLGILFHGIQNNSSVRMEKSLLLQWYAVNEQIKGRNVVMNKKCVELTEMLKQDGFESCILKGQGNALLYEVRGESLALLRMPGDIDVWVRPSERLRVKGERLKIREIIRYVRTKNPNAKACYHHVDGGSYKGVEFEIHYRPSFMNNMINNRRLQRWCEEQAREQFVHEVELPGGTGSICVPMIHFNYIYQMSHIYNHVNRDGIGLRQMIDYYYLLKADGRGKKEDVEKTMRWLGMYKVATAVMWVLHEVLGLEKEYLIVPPNERLGRFLLDEIMIGGNFGQYEVDGKRMVVSGRLTKNIQRLQRDFRLLSFFPSECLWEPVFRIYHWFWRLAH